MNKLTDDSKMPFGCHEGKKMIEVPAGYLLLLWDNGVFREAGQPLHEYIKFSFTALEGEARDVIIKNRPKP